ncbi:MAG TPA: OmpW family outer membrane protein [Thermoanaerobaculia bacterium]|nr:OmpW family outer membrane protein [Thermoanaerobaculia bacterium]
MKRILLAIGLISVFATPVLVAQDRSVDIIVYATRVDLSGDSVVNGTQSIDDLRVNFDSDLGYGAAVNVFFSNRISAEFAAAVVNPDVDVRTNTGPVQSGFIGDSQVIPLTATLQFHFAPQARFDPYIGAGAAYVLFDNVENGRSLGSADVRSIDLDDDVGLVLNGGLTIKFSRLFGLNLDAKYVPTKSSARAVFATGPGQDSEIEVNPLMISAGLRLTF